MNRPNGLDGQRDGERGARLARVDPAGLDSGRQAKGQTLGATMTTAQRTRFRAFGPPAAFATAAALVGLAALLPPIRAGGDDAKNAQVGESFRVPYKLTETNHFLVRARINGEGPFNLIVDTGAPALYLSEEAAERAGVEPKRQGDYFARVEEIEFEGGARLEEIQTRVEDIFQLVGMNALGLPGKRLDGMIGFNVLARYRVEIDPTDDRMTWTRLDYDPPDIVVPRGFKGEPPAGVKALDLIGGFAQLAAVFVGKQPEDQYEFRGFLGVVLDEREHAVVVSNVLPDSPAAEAGLEPGDRLVSLDGQATDSLAAAFEAASEVRPGDAVTARVKRSTSEADADETETIDLTLEAEEGL